VANACAGFSVGAAETELRDLMVRGLAGDGGAHAELLERLTGRLRAYFRRRLGRGGDSEAEDLVQETLIAIHVRRETYDPGQPITGWVYAIARYKLVDCYRRAGRRGVAVPIDDVAELFAHETADEGTPARDVAALLDQLPERQRAAIRLTKLEQLSAREAAARLGVSEAAVKVSVHRGLKKLAALVARGKA
jgi:RNA polymerase sigma-70 factor (ECF subfamily)